MEGEYYSFKQESSNYMHLLINVSATAEQHLHILFGEYTSHPNSCSNILLYACLMKQQNNLRHGITLITSNSQKSR